MNPTILAAALELARLHGIPFGVYFLLDRGVSPDVIAELFLEPQLT
jgi:hypothetical protein